MTACPVKRSGQKEFAFEFGKKFRRHISAVNATFCKVLVRYSPSGGFRDEPASGGALEEVVQSSCAERETFHVRVVGPGGTSAAADSRSRQGRLRFTPPAWPHRASDSSIAGVRHRTQCLESRRHGPARGLCPPRRGGAPRWSRQR